MYGLFSGEVPDSILALSNGTGSSVSSSLDIFRCQVCPLAYGLNKFVQERKMASLAVYKIFSSKVHLLSLTSWKLIRVWCAVSVSSPLTDEG